MVAGGASMAIASMWASMAAWFTPTVFFCVANLIIATIFIASNNKNKNHNHHDHTVSTSTVESQQQYPHEPKTATYSSSSRLAQSIHLASDYVTPPELSDGDELSPSEPERQPLSQLVRAPSFLDRVKSFRIATAFDFGAASSQPETVESQQQYPHEPKTATYSSSSRLAQSIHLASGYVTPPELSDGDELSPSEPERQPLSQLVRAPSFLDRVKSFRIASAFDFGAASSQPETMYTDPDHDPDSDHHVIRSKSEKTTAKMKKSRSEMRITGNDDEDVDLRRPATARERRSHDVDEEVDAKADDFISRFKQQLKLQRVESLVRYKEMLNRRSFN